MKQVEKSTQPLWFLRLEGRVTGPFPSGAVRRFVVLGRVRLDQEISRDRKQWLRIRSLPEVIPPDIRKALENGDPDRLLPDLLREDERSGLDRRRTPVHSAAGAQRRGGERRQEEPELLQKHRQAKTELRIRKQQRRFPLAGILVLGALFLLAIGYGVYLGSPPALDEPECAASPAPGVNWRNCRLDGLTAESGDLQGARLTNARLRGARLSGALLNDADLQYADLSGADLSYGEFRNARMKGTGLRAADLTNADLTGADLRYADLRNAQLGGALLDGARLDHAIWLDGGKCLPGSSGQCLRE